MSRPLYEYAQLWRTCEILPVWRQRVEDAVATVVRGVEQYSAVEDATGVPWPWIGLVHLRESGCDFKGQILNGEPWTRKTQKVPRGRGPWKSWSAAAVEAMLYYELSEIEEWTVPVMLREFEEWNGWRYWNKGKQSPYLWSGANHGVGVGKFTSDGKYSSRAVDKQVGAASALRRIVERNYWRPERMSAESGGYPVLYDHRGERICDEARNLQIATNGLIEDTCGLVEPLKVDGWAGPKTSAAWRYFGGTYLPGDPRNETHG